MYLEAFGGIWKHWRNFESLGGIWRHLEAFGGIWRHLEALGGFGRLWVALGGIWEAFGRHREALGGTGRYREALYRRPYSEVILSNASSNAFCLMTPGLEKMIINKIV
jgi:hypothetical protein